MGEGGSIPPQSAPTSILQREGLELAGRIAAKTGAKLLAETFNARMERGAGRVPVERIPYPVDMAVGVLAPFRHLILIGSKTPVAFFAYPNKPSLLAAPGAQIHPVARREDDVLHALGWLADALGAHDTAFVPAP